MDKSQKIMSDFIVYSKYAKYIPELKRRETFEEICDRYHKMMALKFRGNKKALEELSFAMQFVRRREVLPSMRMLQFAGPAIDKNNARCFNCSYSAIDSIDAFSEALFLLLSGCGYGFSVQSHHIEKLPAITKPTKTRRYVISDNLEGWADSIKILFSAYMKGKAEPRFDYSDIREKGTKLVTSGGKAPGPQPLKDCIYKIKAILDNKKSGEQLTSLECHDIICHIADAVLAGGIRRASCISFFDIDDEDMLTCKSGNWYETNPQRGRANNSPVMVRHKADEDTFNTIFSQIRASGYGEPGLFFTNHEDHLSNPCQPAFASIITHDGEKTFADIDAGSEIWSKEGWTIVTAKYHTGIKSVYRITTADGCEFVGTLNHEVVSMGQKIEVEYSTVIDTFSHESEGGLTYTSPSPVIKKQFIGKFDVYKITVDNDSHTYWSGGCDTGNCNEISLQSKSFCNLTTINIASVTSQEDFNNRVKAAVILGTFQASFTDFHYLREDWKKNTENDSLLGISITGIASNTYLNIDLKEGAKLAKEVNKELAEAIGIKRAKRITAIKPEGTTSLLLGCSSGIHAYYAQFYLRRVRLGRDEVVAKYFIDNYPMLIEDDLGNPKQVILTLPIKSPEGAITRTEGAISLLERIQYFHKHWIKPGHIKGENTHNVSCTVEVRDDEWDEVRDWLWNNKTSYNGIALLPYDGGKFVQAPFEEITEDRFNELYSKIQDMDFSSIIEEEDSTDLKGEVACGGQGCDIK